MSNVIDDIPLQRHVTTPEETNICSLTISTWKHSPWNPVILLDMQLDADRQFLHAQKHHRHQNILHCSCVPPCNHEAAIAQKHWSFFIIPALCISSTSLWYLFW